MKKIVFLSIGLLLCGGLYAQHKVNDFYSVITTVPEGKKTLVMDVIYNNDGTFNGVQERLVESRKPPRSVRNEYNFKGVLIDSLKLIDYKLDTIYILSEYYLPGGSVSEMFKTKKDTFYFAKNELGEYSIRNMEDYYSGLPEDIKTSDSLLYKAIFNWDMDMLIQLIKSTGGMLGSEYFMSATRIILRDNQVVKKDIINFEPAIRWHL